jgi:transcription initiation factor IIE alpha subunit
MKNRFLCPKCRSDLKVGDHIIFSTETERGLRGVLLISPELGNYTIIHDDKFVFIEGEHVDFFCPVCNENLSLEEADKDLAEVLMIDENEEEYKIIFSEIAGKKCTWKVKDDKIIESFGEDADEYTNFWGSGPKY